MDWASSQFVALKHKGMTAGHLLAAVLIVVASTLVVGVARFNTAHAAVPTITAPDRVFGPPVLPLKFTGNDLFAVGTSRVISINAQDAATCNAPNVLIGCSSVKLDV